MVTRRYLLGGEYPSEEFVQASLEKYFFRQGFDIDTGSYIDIFVVIKNLGMLCGILK